MAKNSSGYENKTQFWHAVIKSHVSYWLRFAPPSIKIIWLHFNVIYNNIPLAWSSRGWFWEIKIAILVFLSWNNSSEKTAISGSPPRIIWCKWACHGMDFFLTSISIAWNELGVWPRFSTSVKKFPNAVWLCPISENITYFDITSDILTLNWHVFTKKIQLVVVQSTVFHLLFL